MTVQPLSAPAGPGSAESQRSPSARTGVQKIPLPPPLMPLPVPPWGPESRRLRWTHVVVIATVLSAMLVGLGLLGHGTGHEIPADTAIVRVGAGETIWDVAQRVAPESDPRAVVARIRQLNGMEGSALQPGQRLRVPDGR